MAKEHTQDEHSDPEYAVGAGIGAAVDIADLVAAHYQELYGYAYRLAGTAADAEDLVQQTFLIARQKIGQLREAGKARAWLFAIIRSCFLRNIKKKQPVAATTLQMEMDEQEGTVEEVSEFSSRQLQDALDRIPDEYRIVLVMFYYENCRYKTIAEKLELPIGTVMSRLARGKDRLRALLAE